MAPMKRKSGVKRRFVRKPKRRTNRMYKSVSDLASCSVTNTLVEASANQMYVIDNVRLADFDRAVQVAQGYQRFRITGCKLTVKPVFDTYAFGAGALYQKPNLYYIVDKTGSLPDNITLQSLKEAGARSRVLDEKPFTIRWRPSVIVENQAQIVPGPTFAGPSGYLVSPWLATNQNNTNVAAWVANATNHCGIKFYIEQVGNGGAQLAIPFPMDLTVEFQFTKPSWSQLTGAPARTIEYKVKNNSPDGVEGGADGV